MNREGEPRPNPKSNGETDAAREPGHGVTLYRPLPPPSKQTFLLLERHRPASAVDLSPRGLRQSRRYENLMLAAAVGEMQRDCLVSTPDCEWIGRGGRRALLRTVDMSLERLAGMVEISGRRLSHRKRVHAELRARRRFEEICIEVAAEVQGTVSVGARPDRRPASGSAAPSSAPARGLLAVPALALAVPSQAFARLRSVLPDGRAQTVSTLAAFTVLALGVGLSGWPFGDSQQAGGGVGGVSAAEGAGSRAAELAALRPSAPRGSGLGRAGDGTVGAHSHDLGRGAGKSKTFRAGGGSPGRCRHPLDGLGPLQGAPGDPGTGGGGNGAPSGGGSEPSSPGSTPGSPVTSNPGGAVTRTLASVQSAVGHATAQPIPSQAASGVTSTATHTASGVKQTVSGAAAGVLGH